MNTCLLLVADVKKIGVVEGTGVGFMLPRGITYGRAGMFLMVSDTLLTFLVPEVF